MSPILAIAIPAATTAAAQLVQQVVAQRPFAQFFGSAEVAGDSSAGVSLNDLSSHVGGLLDQLRTRIADKLAVAGIDPAESFDLSTDADGEIVVVDHPLRGQIAAALAGDVSIRETLGEIAVMQSVLAAAGRRLDFAQRYAVDPFTAESGGNAPSPPLSLTFAGGQLVLNG